MKVCLFDFNGYAEPEHFPVSMSADYEDGLVEFGGDWFEIPDWIVDHEPTEEEIVSYVKTATQEIMERERRSNAQKP